MAWLAGYTYRKAITLNRASGAVTNYQMKLLVGESAGATGEDVDCNNHCNPGFNDIRFTKADGVTLLDFWFETSSGDSPNCLGTFWIKFDSIGTGDTTFYMYYGKTNPLTFSYYNGTATTNGSKYNIGFAYGSGDYGFTKFAMNPVLGAGPGVYDAGSVKDPFVLKIGNKYLVYYTSITTGSELSISVATTYDGVHLTKYGSNPILQKTGTGWEQTGVEFASVYDTGVVGTKRYRMLYTGYDGTNFQTGYAFSEDGFAWTRGAANPVIPVGADGTWDDVHACVTSNVYLDGTTYKVYYSGHDGTRWQVGLVTFTDFEGVYTKSGSNPVIASRTSALQTLTVQTNIGTTTVTVADTSVFQVKEPVWMYDGTSAEFNRVASITDGTHLELTSNTLRNYPSESSNIRSWAYGSVTTRCFKKDGATWKHWVTCFKAFFDVLNRENTGYLTSADGVAWTFDYLNSPPVGYDPETVTWDQYSVENVCIIQNPGGLSSSNGANTFLFFDDFPGVALTAQWNSTQGTPEVSGRSEVTLKCGATWDAIRATGYSVTFARFRSRFLYTVVHNHAVGLSNSAVNNTVYADDSEYFLGVVPASDIYAISSDEGTLDQNSIFHAISANVYYVGEFRWKSGECKFYINDGAAITHTAHVANEALNPRADGVHGAGAYGNEWVDWMFVSQYLDPEPAWGSWGSEETEEPLPSGTSFVAWIN